MYVNIKKEEFDKDGKVVFYKAISLDLETTSEDVLNYFINRKGWEIIDYSMERRA